MGCSQSKSADVLASTTQKKELVELKTTEGKTQEEHETEASKKQDEEPVDEAPMTLEPVAPVIDMVAKEQAPDSSAVDVPDSVRANFSSFNISFIDPTVSAPTSATTEPNVASTRVAVISKTLREDVADEEMKPEVTTKTEGAAAEQIEVDVVRKVDEPAATTEEPLATVRRVNKTVVEPVAAALKEETIVVKHEVEAVLANTVATAEIVEESGVGETVEKVDEKASTEVKEVVAAVAELVAASKEVDAAAEQPAGGTEVIEPTDVQPVDEEKAAEPIVKDVPESIQEEQIAEPVEEVNVAEVVVEKPSEPVVANVADSVMEEEMSEPVKDDNKDIESVMVVSKKVADEVLQKNAEPVLSEKNDENPVKETTDIDSVMPAEVAEVGGDAIPHEESDVTENARADAKEAFTVIEEHVAVETSNQIEAVAETRSTVMDKSDSSAALEDGIEAVDSDGVERPSIIDEHSMLEKKEEAESLTSAKEPLASH